jgi:hypothetical protein
MKHTHHVDLYKCTAPPGVDPATFFEPHLGSGYDCYHTSNYFPLEHCSLFEFQWSVGGKVTVFPEKVGVPIEGGEWFMTEIHYDNPEVIEVF